MVSSPVIRLPEMRYGLTPLLTSISFPLLLHHVPVPPSRACLAVLHALTRVCLAVRSPFVWPLEGPILAFQNSPTRRRLDTLNTVVSSLPLPYHSSLH